MHERYQHSLSKHYREMLIAKVDTRAYRLRLARPTRPKLAHRTSLLSWAHRYVTTVDASPYPFHNG
jgi:hypothetical protein